MLALWTELLTLLEDSCDEPCRSSAPVHGGNSRVVARQQRGFWFLRVEGREDMRLNGWPNMDSHRDRSNSWSGLRRSMNACDFSNQPVSHQPASASATERRRRAGARESTSRGATCSQTQPGFSPTLTTLWQLALEVDEDDNDDCSNTGQERAGLNSSNTRLRPRV